MVRNEGEYFRHCEANHRFAQSNPKCANLKFIDLHNATKNTTNHAFLFKQGGGTKFVFNF